MQIKKIVRNDKDGSFTGDFALTNEQVGVLVNYAINSLLAKGVLTIDEEEFTTQQPSELN